MKKAKTQDKPNSSAKRYVLDDSELGAPYQVSSTAPLDPAIQVALSHLGDDSPDNSKSTDE